MAHECELDVEATTYADLGAGFRRYWGSRCRAERIVEEYDHYFEYRTRDCDGSSTGLESVARVEIQLRKVQRELEGCE